jgi:archaellum component FlaG (FlaF/FlaG flagellin family)
MRTTTKALLGLAAVAASVATSMAQNVYSLNVVGYVNHQAAQSVASINSGFELICNPLNNTSGGNNITNLFANAPLPDGASIYRWNAITSDLDGTIYTYFTSSHQWDNGCSCPTAHNGFVLNPGEGAFFYNPSSTAITNTYTGDVLTAPYYLGNPLTTNTLVGNGQHGGVSGFNGIGSTIPVGGNFTNSIAGVVPGDGDSVYTWSPTKAGGTGDLDDRVATYFTSSSTWNDGVGFPTNQVPVGIGCFYYRTGNDFTWGRNYTVQ